MAQILATGFQRSMKDSQVNVGSTSLAFAQWDVTYTGDDLDTGNFESGGLNEGILGFEGCDWNCGGDWDAGTNPYDDPPGFYPRDDLTDLGFVENTTDDVGWLFDYARVRSSNNGGDVKGKVTFKASGKSQGTFTVPTGSV